MSGEQQQGKDLGPSAIKFNLTSNFSDFWHRALINTPKVDGYAEIILYTNSIIPTYEP